MVILYVYRTVNGALLISKRTRNRSNAIVIFKSFLDRKEHSPDQKHAGKTVEMVSLYLAEYIYYKPEMWFFCVRYDVHTNFIVIQSFYYHVLCLIKKARKNFQRPYFLFGSIGCGIVRRFYMSRFLTSCPYVSINFLRGSTLSPIRIPKSSSASTAS